MGELVDCDLEHLRLLKICYYILAGTIGLFALFSLIYIGLGALLVSGLIPSNQRSGGDPGVAGLILLGIGLCLLLFALAIAALNYWTGRSLRDRRHRIFCLISACLSLLNMPFGTAIGICTIIVLGRPSVQALFEAPPTV